MNEVPAHVSRHFFYVLYAHQNMYTLAPSSTLLLSFFRISLKYTIFAAEF